MSVLEWHSACSGLVYETMIPKRSWAAFTFRMRLNLSKGGGGEGCKGPIFHPHHPFKRRDIPPNCDYKMLFLGAIPVATFVYLA